MKFVRAPRKFYFHYPFPVTVVVTEHEGRINMMSSVWHTQLSFDPPLYGVLISPKRFTFDLLRKSKQFTLNFLDFEFMDVVALVGNTSGRDIDKSSVFDIPLDRGRLVDVPILAESYAVYECELVEEREFGDHTMFVGKILGVHYDDNAYYGEKYHPRVDAVKPVLYIGDDSYLTTDPTTLRRYGREDVKSFLREWGGERG